MFHVDWKLDTVGDGYWSSVAKTVQVTRLEMPYINAEGTFGELRVYFDTKTWSVPMHGLIYTDSLFLDGLLERLHIAGLDAGAVDYSEQGMQGTDYVSLDVTEGFIASWRQRMPVLA